MKNIKFSFAITYIIFCIWWIMRTYNLEYYWDTEVYQEFILNFPSPYIYMEEGDSVFLKVAYLPFFYVIGYWMTFITPNFAYLIICFSSIIFCFLNIKDSGGKDRSYFYLTITLMVLLPFNSLEYGNIEGILTSICLFCYFNEKIPEIIKIWIFALCSFKIWIVIWVFLYCVDKKPRNILNILTIYFFLIICLTIPMLFISQNILEAQLNIILKNPIMGIISGRIGQQPVLEPYLILLYILALLFRTSLWFPFLILGVKLWPAVKEKIRNVIIIFDKRKIKT